MLRANQMVLGAVCLAGAVHTSGQKQEQPKRENSSGSVEIQMHNVNLRMTGGVVLQIRNVRGRLEPTGSGPVTLDDRNSFVLDIDSAVMAISTASLGELLNSYVFAYDGAPLKK